MIEVTLARWTAWLPGVESPEAWRAWAASPYAPGESAAPAATEVPALLRRRCDALSRALLHVAGECCPAGATPSRSEVATVFATRLGPLGAVTENLESLAAGRLPSPMTFSHAVHNTALGLFSIWAGNRAPASALAAGEATFAHGWLEAALLLHREPDRPVLLVGGDAALPEALAALPRPAPAPLGPHALALLLRANGPGERVRFGRVDGSPSDARTTPLPLPLAFLCWWIAGGEALTLGSAGGAWRWQRLGAR
jgi:hypothetical protein